jgi:hypothetical protein
MAARAVGHAVGRVAIEDVLAVDAIFAQSATDFDHDGPLRAMPQLDLPP